MSIRDRIVELRRIKARELAANPLNFRTHPKRQREALRGVLREIGIAGALLAYQDPEHGLTLIDGHLRKDEQPETEWPVLITDLSRDEANVLIATYDPLAGLARIDAKTLTTLLSQVKIDDGAIRSMLKGLAKQAKISDGDSDGEVPNAIDELRKKWQTEMGQLWEIPSRVLPGRAHRVLCGDSTALDDLGRVMNGSVAQIAVTSPPYNLGIEKFKPSGMHTESGWVDKVRRLAYQDSLPEDQYQEHQRRALVAWFAILADGGSLFYNHKNRYQNKEVISPLRWLPGPFRLRQEIVWFRPGGVTHNARMFLPSDERIYWMYKGDDFYIDQDAARGYSSVWEISPQVNKDHPVAFPVELPARCIRCCSRPGDLVFEPHCGSGTTLVASEQLGRICHCIELSPGYVAIILERMGQLGLEPRLT